MATQSIVNNRFTGSFEFLKPVFADPQKLAAGLATREAFGQAMVELGSTNPNLVVIDADLGKSTMSLYFLQHYPERFFRVGVAEQSMICVAAGLSVNGKVPVATTFAVFASGRAFDQLRVAVAQPHLNVKVVGSHSGLTVGEDGKSAESIEDLALMCSLVGFNVIVPADAVQTAQATAVAVATEGPFYIRTSRAVMPLVYGPDYQFVHGKADQLRQGGDATVIACGVMVKAALDAAELLAAKGTHVRVLNMASLAPLDEEAVRAAADETGAIVTAEEHLEHGGLGSLVANVLVQYRPIPQEFVAIKGRYGQSGKPAELLKEYGLTAEDIVAKVEHAIHRKTAGSGRGFPGYNAPAE